MAGIYELKQIQKCYLIQGEEDWIKNSYLQQIKEKIVDKASELMNYTVLEGKDVALSSIVDYCETMPFFADKKLLVVKNSELFKAGKKDESEKLSEWIKNLPEYMVLVFCENEVDKRGKLYKQLKSLYTVIECEYPGDDALVELLKQQHKEMKISHEDLRYFAQNMPSSMSHALGEFQKLMDYAGGKAVSRREIDEVCVFSLEQRVFTLIKEMTQKNTTQALRIYKTMMDSKESPIGVLVLIARQYRVMMQVKYLLRAHTPIKQIASEVGLPLFVAKETAAQTENFSFKQLESILSLCLESDIAIKTGKMESTKCIEMLIVQCIYS